MLFFQFEIFVFQLHTVSGFCKIVQIQLDPDQKASTKMVPTYLGTVWYCLT